MAALNWKMSLQHKTWWTELKEKSQLWKSYFKNITSKESKLKIYEILLQINKEKKLKKRVYNMNKKFREKQIQVANKHRKLCLVLIEAGINVLKQWRNTISYPLDDTSTKLAKPKKT